jgi:hypothetical protein
MTWISVDVESDGPIPGDYSMVCFGAVIVEPGLKRSFYGQLRPISDQYLPDDLSISGFSRQEILQFAEPEETMAQFKAWLDREVKGKPLFVSDNNGYDWQFINWYFHHFVGENPFGFSSTNLNCLYKGMQGDFFASNKHLCQTEHTHHPVDDAKGVAEVLLHMKFKMGLKIRL